MKVWHFDFCKENPNRIIREKRTKSKELQEKINEKMKNLPKVQCPHCDIIISPQGKRWHFDRCKNKKEDNE